MLQVSAEPRPAATRRRDLTLPAGFIPPCLPMMAARPPSGSLWLHEIKHDGFRVIAQKDGEQVRLYGLRGDDLTQQFPLVAEAVARLPSSCTIDGEAVVCDGGAAASSGAQRDGDVFLHVFDLIELEGGDRRRDPLLQRKIDLIRLLANAAPGLTLDGWIDGRESDAATLFRRACSLGLKGIVSKRKDSRYVSGRSPYWLKMKNPASEAVRHARWAVEGKAERLRLPAPAALSSAC